MSSWPSSRSRGLRWPPPPPQIQLLQRIDHARIEPLWCLPRQEAHPAPPRVLVIAERAAASHRLVGDVDRGGHGPAAYMCALTSIRLSGRSLRPSSDIAIATTGRFPYELIFRF